MGVKLARIHGNQLWIGDFNVGCKEIVHEKTPCASLRWE